MGIKGFMSPKEQCVICGNEAGWTSNNTAKGRICSDCMKKLSQAGITILNIKSKDIDELKLICGHSANGLVSAASAPVSAYEKLSTYKIINPSINLKDGEVCFYQGNAKAYHVKNVVTGSKGKGAGVSVRLAKGLSVRTSGGASKNIREDIKEYFPGTLYLTNMRLVLLSSKYGFDVKIPKISQFSVKKDGFQLYVGDKCYSVITSDVKNIVEIMNLMNQAVDEQESTTEAITLNENKSAIEEIRDYKKLLDEGIITQEEFDAKKKQILGL